ncbi:type II CAAX endopeptidase family protein [Natronococcus sp. A-GB1]|uniref:CPBP family intramembrane glutamic endopeptidase n=1 Tax=Natronococcus sp. A-GB1 TaxID=3037648 RepID=UPI00241F6399|nr:type II CAAX endopeptidase family protein [Natronococcus sp. A-GB1]MDG5761277.1 type II CAAX endopeptidase family protein [Natronococcus sp. A-GB1]
MTETPTQRLTFPVLVGLVLALFGFPLGRILLNNLPGLLSSQSFFQVYKWLLAGALLILVVAVERQPLSSIGVRRPEGWDVWIGFVVGVICFFTIPVMIAVVGWVGLEPGWATNGSQELGIEALLFSLFIGITAGITEEITYRGYALEHIESLTNSVWFAGGVTAFIFIIIHYGSHDIGGLLVITPLTIILTAAYVWRRNILIPIIGHVFINGVGTVVAILSLILSSLS